MASEELIWEITDLLDGVKTEDSKLLTEALAWIAQADGKSAADFLRDLDIREKQ